MEIQIPETALVVLIGASGSGKSTFAAKHFKSTEVLSSDYCRGLVSDDENDQAATQDAFDVLQYIAGKRLAAGRLTVVDATNVQREARASLVRLAREHHCLVVGVVFDVPEELCIERNATRTDRDFGPHVIRNQRRQLRRSRRGLKREGFRQVYTFESAEEVASATIAYTKLWVNKRGERGPFDIIGDIHGCYDELIALLTELGYIVADNQAVTPPEGRKAVFLGDLVDRGPKVPDVLRLVMGMVQAGTALCVPGNHDVKLVRALDGRKVQVRHGLAESLEQLEQETEEFRAEAKAFMDGLISHYVLDDGDLVVAHAGLTEKLQGRASRRVREFALYGETTGETDEFGLPIRYNWAGDYRGRAQVVYGHTPVPESKWLNRTINIDTGCVFGGKLTALRYPERELVSVPAAREYSPPVKPLTPPSDARDGQSLDIQDVIGKRIVHTELRGNITVRADQSAAALEAMSRFAVDPRWLIYLPPTMSPCETSAREDYLEYPTEALSYYRTHGVDRVVCQEKHMGSRVVLVVCRDEAVSAKRFDVESSGLGVCYSRTGRPFFSESDTEQALLTRVCDAVTAAGLWDELESDWLALDCELMPWSAKAQALLRTQYAPVAAAGQSSLAQVGEALVTAAGNGLDVSTLQATVSQRSDAIGAYATAYRQYCWPVEGLSGLKLAPFHILAGASRVYSDCDHGWHMSTLDRMCVADAEAHPEVPVLQPTNRIEVDTTDADSVAAATAWWESLTASGGEGMVVKPWSFVARGDKGVLQPAVKCRGREYLRIIYGPDYLAEENLERLRHRGLGRKRSLAMREFSLGLESLSRFVAGDPLYRVHECAFAVLAMESEPVDPRL
jgi:protein phosphatase